MDQKEALKIARIFFDEAAYVVENPQAPTSKERDALPTGDPRRLLHRCKVGFVSTVAGISLFHVHGEGDTWEDALTRADQWQDTYRTAKQKRYTPTGKLRRYRKPIWQE